jgi:tetratricopeptide (TPR) repeat protein
MFLIALSADLGAAARELAVARDILLAAKDSSVLLQYYLNYGVVLCDLGEREAALREFESGRPFLDATTGNLKSAFYLNRGVALAGLNLDAEAIECYREGLQTAGPIHRPTILTNLGNSGREPAKKRDADTRKPSTQDLLFPHPRRPTFGTISEGFFSKRVTRRRRSRT